MLTSKFTLANSYTYPKTKFIAANTRTNNVPLSGDPCRCGQMVGVAMADFDATTRVGVARSNSVEELTVSGIDSSGVSGADANVAVLGGDAIYFDEAKNPPLSKRAGGVLFGYAMGDHAVQQVASGNTTTKINVKVGK